MSADVPIKNQITTFTEAIKPIVENSGYFLEEITLIGGSPKVLTVVIDSVDALTLDQVTIVTKEISAVLADTPYPLEVTSPGIERPLILARHWRKNLGRLVKISLHDGSVVSGRIREVSESAATIDDTSIEYATIKTALIEIEFVSLKDRASN
jgi:ribosome maturation factor RimP